MQTVILDAPRRIVLERVHILDDVDFAVLIFENVHPQCDHRDWQVLQIVLFGRHAGSAYFISVVGDIARPVKFKDIRAVGVVMLDDSL